MQGAIHGPLDRALYYEGDLFERFFQQASQALQPGGRVVLVFSSVMQLLRPDLPHPIDTELEQGRFVLETKMRRRVKPTGGRRTRERVEVWVLAAA
jgi:tRNA G10  N-methylase Trm11